MKEFRLFVIGGEDDESGVLSLLENSGENSALLTFKFRGKKFIGHGSDYFAAFEEVRKELEKISIIPFCYGASLNVYPLPANRVTNRGLSAYCLELGKPTTSNDLVEIFSESIDVMPSNLENQRSFYEDWLKSLQT